ncbi:protein gustavus-like [Dreissena polymorpha]|nr:protein gustavus-like [Dreissena polymorpha]
MLIVAMAILVMLCAETVQPGDPMPPWVMTIQPDPALDAGIQGISDGLTVVDHNTVFRHRKGHFEADGAQWGCALSKGKHVFEITWPIRFRDACASVGVGTKEAPLFVKPRDSLVGCNRHSWGLDISKCKALHKGEILCTYPRGKSVPIKFFMFVDCDSGSIAFGTDRVYWGSSISFPKTALPVYPMMGLIAQGAQVSMIYRGTGGRLAPNAAAVNPLLVEMLPQPLKH